MDGLLDRAEALLLSARASGDRSTRVEAMTVLEQALAIDPTVDHF
jgi:hypothetical protein